MNAMNIAKKGMKAVAIKKGIGMTGSLLKWGAVAGLGYMGYKYLKNRNVEEAATPTHTPAMES